MKTFTKCAAFIVLVGGLVLSIIAGSSLQLLAIGFGASGDMPFNWMLFLPCLLVTLTLFTLLMGMSVLLERSDAQAPAVARIATPPVAVPVHTPTSTPSTNRIQCPRCGSDMPNSNPVCIKCGHKLTEDDRKRSSQAAKSMVRCPSCDTPNSPGNKYCAYCNAKMSTPDSKSR